MEMQTVEVAARLPNNTAVRGRIDMTPRGLFAIGGLVSAILLSTAVLVRVAVRSGKQRAT